MIDKFDGEYDFLSNFYSMPIVYDGLRFQSAEAAYQAQKTTDPSERRKFQDLTAGHAKRLGRKIKVESIRDWDEIKDRIMYAVCTAKFKQSDLLLKRLLETGDEELVEGNTWGDTYWGVCNGVGENHLGKILMRIRSELRQWKEGQDQIDQVQDGRWWAQERTAIAPQKTELKCACGHPVYMSGIEIRGLKGIVHQLHCPGCGLSMRSPVGDQDGEWLKHQWQRVLFGGES